MSSYTSLLIDRYVARGGWSIRIFLLMYVIGHYDQSILDREAFDRVAAYSAEDFRLLCNLTSLFRKKVTTPYVLAEVSNWIGYLSRSQKIECLRGFSKTLDGLSELQSDSLELGTRENFPYLGLTDTALATFAQDYLIVTDDARLIFHINDMGLEGLNINHLRQELWLMT